MSEQEKMVWAAAFAVQVAANSDVIRAVTIAGIAVDSLRSIRQSGLDQLDSDSIIHLRDFLIP